MMKLIDDPTDTQSVMVAEKYTGLNAEALKRLHNWSSQKDSLLKKLSVVQAKIETIEQSPNRPFYTTAQYHLSGEVDEIISELSNYSQYHRILSDLICNDHMEEVLECIHEIEIIFDNLNKSESFDVHDAWKEKPDIKKDKLNHIIYNLIESYFTLR
jgi:hypothetical protein